VRPRADATHVLVEAPSGYTANLPLPAVLDDDVLFAWAHNGEPLPPEHGGPLRLVVLKRYGWKSVKWATRVRVLNRDVRGYWEERGYHNDADPWLEQRYSWQEGR
jgi:DMSO/TMAO reductase YedYZ molybdopterin-dependent catalytic subunit